jgi:hypothetical protein
MPAPMLTEALAKKALAAASTMQGSCMPPMLGVLRPRDSMPDSA